MTGNQWNLESLYSQSSQFKQQQKNHFLANKPKHLDMERFSLIEHHDHHLQLQKQILEISSILK